MTRSMWTVNGKLRVSVLAPWQIRYWAKCFVVLIISASIFLLGHQLFSSLFDAVLENIDFQERKCIDI